MRANLNRKTGQTGNLGLKDWMSPETRASSLFTQNKDRGKHKKNWWLGKKSEYNILRYWAWNKDHQGEDNEFLKWEGNSVKAEVLKSAHKGRWRKHELGVKELIKRKWRNKMADGASERRQHQRTAAEFRAKERPGPQSVSRGVAPSKHHAPHIQHSGAYTREDTFIS